MRKKKNQIDYLEELEQQRKEKNSSILNEPVETKPTEEVKKEEIAKPEKKKRSKYPIYIGIILVVTTITLVLSLKDDFNGIVSNFSTMNVPYFIYGSLCFIGCFLINSLILFLFARRYRKKYYFHQAMANDCIGNFYNCITPSATGGQLMQAYTYKKQGISIANGTSCLVMNFIVYQGVMIVLATVSVISKSSVVFGEGYAIPFGGGVSLPFWVVMILGYALQFLVIGLVLLMSTWRRFHNFILNKGVNFLAKIKIIKKPDETRRSFAVAIDSFKVELKNLLVNPRFLILIVLLHIACFACRYTIPYFINQSVLGDMATSSFNFAYNWWDTFCFTSIHKMATELIPIPGAAGVSELFYVSVFEAAYQLKEGVVMDLEVKTAAIRSYIIASQILWRVVTFYVPLVVTAIVTALYKGKPSKEEFNKASSGAQTYLTLTIDTFEDRRKTYQTIHSTKQINRKDFEKWKKNKTDGENKK